MEEIIPDMAIVPLPRRGVQAVGYAAVGTDVDVCRELMPWIKF